MHNQSYVRKVAVLGAGVMGTQIAAHFGNARVPVVLFDLKSATGSANGLVEAAIKNLQKLNPKPLSGNKSLDYITIANYDDDLQLLTDCNLIIEAIAERLDWKEALYNKIASHVNPNAIIASNTSGLSIEHLAGSLPTQFRAKFCGIHFFNPPRYMSLVEIIPHKGTDQHVIPDLETFLVTTLGKSVIVAKDTPNFIANRLGVFSMLATCIHTKEYNLSLDVVDKLTGKELGRAKSATYRTLDVVGIDVFSHVVKTMGDNCRDGFEAFYTLPDWISKLLSNNALGQKTKIGCYKKDKDGLKVLDITTGVYNLATNKPSKTVLDILRQKDWATKFDALHSSNEPEAKFLWACFRDVFHYAAVMLGQIADSPRDMDMAIRAGFGWNSGVFEIWQLAGWSKITTWIKEDIDAGRTLAKIALPEWVFEQKHGVYLENKHYNILENKMVVRHELPVYKRQLFPDLVINEVADITSEMQTLYENPSVRLWHSGDGIGVLSFKTKMCTIGMEVLTGIDEAITTAEEKCSSMVIWQERDIFSAGANLEEFGFSFMMNGVEAIEKTISEGHRVIVKRIRYSRIPIIAAVKGYAFGGGCEIMLHCDGVVAALESYIGLIEAGVGLLPGWGGTTEMAYRASCSIDPWRDFEMRYKNLAMAKVATSAHEALEMGFLRDSDTIILNKNELLYVAKAKAKFMAEAGYRPPVAPKFAVFGEQGIANVNGLLANMRAGAQISEHDLLIAQNIATVMCGGAIEKGSVVSEDWVLKIEAEKFKQLAESPKTSERIQYMLENGKPLRN
jgi:3-hydroxyacyl-CoA dehydrogenase